MRTPGERAANNPMQPVVFGSSESHRQQQPPPPHGATAGFYSAPAAPQLPPTGQMGAGGHGYSGQPSGQMGGQMSGYGGQMSGQMGGPVGGYGGQMSGQMGVPMGVDPYSRQLDGQMSGAMSGRMSGATSGGTGYGGASYNDDKGSMKRAISATLLGGGEPDEPPILVELGIDFAHIREKTKIVLWPRRAMIAPGSTMGNDDDFAGPLLFVVLLGTLLLFKGKVQFGAIYGVFVTGWLGIWAVLNLMSPKGIDVYRTASVMGYSLLPLVMLAALSIPVNMTGFAGALCVPVAVLWCSNAASLFFVAALDADDRRWLLAYPVALFYTCFALIAIF